MWWITITPVFGKRKKRKEGLFSWKILAGNCEDQRLSLSSSSTASVQDDPQIHRLHSSAQATGQPGDTNPTIRSLFHSVALRCHHLADIFHCRFHRKTKNQVRNTTRCNSSTRHLIVTYLLLVLCEVTHAECSGGFSWKSMTLQTAKREKVKGHRLQTILCSLQRR